MVQDYDRKEGFYWELGDEKQSRCPRIYIKEQPESWYAYTLAYSAYEAGFLPSQGGLDQQPALLLPVMAVISSAVNDEQEIKRTTAAQRQTIMDKSRQGALKPPHDNANGRAELPSARRE